MIARLVVVAGLGAASTAAAEPPRTAARPAASAVATPAGDPDPSVAEAADANLESTENRQGMTFAASIGGGLIIGFGIDDSVGRGGAVNLRLGRVATPHTVLTIEVGATAALHKPSMMSGTETNTNANLLLGAQYYINRSLWVRGAAGVGRYMAPKSKFVAPNLVDVTLTGPVVLAGIGLEVARVKWAAFEIEIGTSGLISSDGLLMASNLTVGLAFD
jgi:hypothetical protein